IGQGWRHLPPRPDRQVMRAFSGKPSHTLSPALSQRGRRRVFRFASPAPASRRAIRGRRSRSRYNGRPFPRGAPLGVIGMKVLVIGNGGREHALAWKLKQSPRVDEVIVAPGNAGTARERGVRNADVAVTDLDGLLQLAKAEKVGLTVVGPEVPLVAGVVDKVRNAGLRIFGPRAIAAQLEGSKAFAKDFLLRHNIPTARYAVFTELNPALAYVRTHGAPMVIEEFLDGEEASYIVMSDGQHALPMASSQDHKRRDEGDLGPNTGGMGAYSPAPVVTPEVEQRILREVIEPTLRGMAAEGAPFIGFLYAGLMIDRHGAPKVIEYNVRFGDPETQPIMLRLKSDFLDLLEAALDGRLDRVQVEWDP